jgi:DNA replication and repair protein RecF
MLITRVEYRHFRNIDNATLEPAAGVTELYGENGAGKTNALEGVCLFAHGRSFRTPRNAELVGFGHDFAEITLHFNTENNTGNKTGSKTESKRQTQLILRYTADGKRVCYRNGVCIPKLSEFIGSFRAVLFCPDHLGLVKGGPSSRRSFIDTAVSQLNPLYVLSLQRYNYILGQRNSLIKNYYKDNASFNDTIDLWSAQLAKEAAAVSQIRADYIDKLSGYVRRFADELSRGAEDVSLEYLKPRGEAEYISLLSANHDREIRAGVTLYGAHKDDILIKINDRDARSFSSQGQGKSIALALKLAEGEMSRELSGEYPVFLFDDVLSELDSERRAYLRSCFDGKQVVITSCESGSYAGKTINVKNGNLGSGVK